MSELYGNPRRVLHWPRVKGPRAIAALFTGTAAGAGLVPAAPGTMGTLVGIPIAWASAEWTSPARVALWAALTLVGTWACKVYGELMESQDNQNLVIDEVVGLGITAWTLNSASGSWAWFAAFVLFRIFDIVKPPPVRAVDRWSKSKTGWAGGFGVMADDIVAGFQGLLAMVLLQYFGWV